MIDPRANLLPAASTAMSLGPASSAADGVLVRGDLARAVRDLEHRTDALMHAGPPETLLQKAIDAFAPSPARRERRRVDEALVRLRGEEEIAMQKAVTRARTRELEILAETWERACEIEAAKAVAARLLEAHEQIDQLVEASGRRLDLAVDGAVEHACNLSSQAAQQGAAARIARRTASRGAVEEAVYDRLSEAVQGPRRIFPR
jgi:hypothetical protein